MKHLITLLVSLSLLSFGQSSIQHQADSLEQQLKSAKGTSRVKILNLLFGTYINVDPVRATGYTKEALTLAMEYEDANGMAAAYNNLGVAYKNHGALDKALENYLTAESIYSKTGNQDGKAATHNNIGTIYSLKKDFEKSKQFFEEALKSFVAIKDSAKQVVTLNNLGNVYSDLGKYEEALELFHQSILVSDKLHKISIDPLLNIGNVFIRQNNPKEAISYLSKAQTLSLSENDQLTLMAVKSSLANALLQSGDLKGAEQNLQEALTICKNLESFFLEPQILKNLAETYARQNRMGDAYRTMLDYEKSREKIFSEESSRKIAQMEMVIDIHEKEQQIEDLKEDEELKSVQLQRTQLAVIVIVVAILAIALGINAYIQNNKAKRKKR